MFPELQTLVKDFYPALDPGLDLFCVGVCGCVHVQFIKSPMILELDRSQKRGFPG